MKAWSRHSETGLRENILSRRLSPSIHHRSRSSCTEYCQRSFSTFLETPIGAGGRTESRRGTRERYTTRPPATRSHSSEEKVSRTQERGWKGWWRRSARKK